MPRGAYGHKQSIKSGVKSKMAWVVKPKSLFKLPINIDAQLKSYTFSYSHLNLLGIIV